MRKVLRLNGVKKINSLTTLPKLFEFFLKRIKNRKLGILLSLKSIFNDYKKLLLKDQVGTKYYFDIGGEG